jgi:prolyl-tRNA editing enzyme YbaK/EbsC (Cys-tRNA(Pro) deacylase)
MLDDELREQLAEWVRPVTTVPVPDIRVLRRRARKRGMRRAAAAAVVTAVVAAAAVGVVVSLPGTGSVLSRGGSTLPVAGSPPSWSAAPGTRTHGAWQPAGPPLAADASPAVAPYIVIPGYGGDGTAQVRDVFTGQTMVTVQPPPGQFVVGVAAAGDDRTFVLQAEMGGQQQEINGRKVGPPRNPTTVAFDELRLGPDGRPISLVSVLTVPAGDSQSGFAISQDASMLAYANTENNGFETVSLATGTRRSWAPVGRATVAPFSLSWAGDRTLAFEWSTGDNNPPGVGIRVLDVTAPGNLVQASRLIIPYGQYCAATEACQDDPLITPDGSKVMVTRVVAVGDNYADTVVEYSARTGQRLADVMPTIRTPYTGPPCVPLWTDPSGEQVISFCGGHGERYDHGHLSQVTLHPPMYGMNFGALFAWLWVGQAGRGPANLHVMPVDFASFAAALRDLGVAGQVRELPEPAPTAATAAAQLGCEVGAIANSLIFSADGAPLLVMTSGAHRVDTTRVAALVGASAVTRADARSVREWTGQAIGGVAPVGHPAPIRTLVDTWLDKYDVVWAAAGHPHTVFPTSFAELIRITGGTPAEVGS